MFARKRHWRSVMKVIGRLTILASSVAVCCTFASCTPQRTSVVLTYNVAPNAGDVVRTSDLDDVLMVINDRLGRRGRAKALRGLEFHVEIFGDVTNAELDSLKLRIESIGKLGFRALADSREPGHQAIIDEARLATPAQKDVSVAGKKAAEWIACEKLEAHFDNASNDGAVKRQAGSQSEVLVLTDPYDVTGADLTAAEKAKDERGAPAIQVTFDRGGAMRLRRLTSENMPKSGPLTAYRRLGIIFDKRLLSAPKIVAPISNSAIISGGSLSESDVDAIIAIFHAGGLPYPVRLVNEERMSNG